eukprot:COSAG06_NODE_17660_length_927_cov_149.892512_2_plen_51_part_00
MRPVQASSSYADLALHGVYYAEAAVVDAESTVSDAQADVATANGTWDDEV